MNSIVQEVAWSSVAGAALRSGTAAPGCVRPAGAPACGNERQAGAPPGLATSEGACATAAVPGSFTVWFMTAAGLLLGLAGGLVISNFTGDFILPPLLGASFGGAASTAVEM